MAWIEVTQDKLEQIAWDERIHAEYDHVQRRSILKFSGAIYYADWAPEDVAS